MTATLTSAVIGGGISGLTAAHVLARSGPVTLFEADPRLGGHAHTHTVRTRDGVERQVDSGFIVFNHRTYPLLSRLFDELGVVSQPTEMSLSISCDGCGLEYSGGQGPRGLFAQPRRLVSPRHLALLAQVPRFHREARRVLTEGGSPDLTWGEFLRARGFTPDFVSHFAVPFVSCVWSCGQADAERYPAHYLFRFLDNHGMLAVRTGTTWRTVVGGSATYVRAVSERLPAVRTAAPVRAVTRHADGVEVRTHDDQLHRFDRVVVATHADDALHLLADATPQEKEDLSAIDYSDNPTWLHRDRGALPRARAARAAWNYRLRSCRADRDSDTSNVRVSYWMNRLQRFDTDDDLVVTLNPDGWIDPSSVVASMNYRHPVFTVEALEAAARLRSAGGTRLAFAGAHLGWGFHEDGCRSGVEAAARLGASW